MKLELEFYDALCHTSKFVINDITACESDFGYQCDVAPDEAEPYGCGDVKFTRIPATPKALARYGITEPEYELVAGQLEVGLSFGNCGWCS